ncbi:ovostatin-like [Bombina bombina]|uniref:ovostatin-like n=1 Tax=Bombina bombina TaxID=8345 RepID=UPI00235A9E64|nr:ovostatin-like [Bombina bombina]
MLYTVCADNIKQYALILPAMIKSGQTEKVCVNLVGHEEALFLNVVLQHNGLNTTIFDENVPVNQYYKCNDFTVPSVEQSVPVFVLLSAKGNNSNVLERKSVVIDSLENIYKIQMDKPIYRPGHKVRFRLISLNSQLQPIKTIYPVTYLKDPSGSRVAQWLNQESDRGILSFEFQLIRDALPGSYSITAEKQSGNPLYQYFTVEEYEFISKWNSILDACSFALIDLLMEHKRKQKAELLQEMKEVQNKLRDFQHHKDFKEYDKKFETTMNTFRQEIWQFKSRKITRDKKDYDQKQVYRWTQEEYPRRFQRRQQRRIHKGGKTVTFSDTEYEFDSSDNDLQTEEETPAVFQELELGPDGTYNGILDLASFHMQLSGFEMSLTLDITVTEEGTGVQVTESRYVQITSQLAKIRFESMNPNYKRGIPYVVMIKLMDESDRPMPNKEIELEIEGETNQKVTTDEAGKAEYAIDTSSFVRTNFTLKASYQDPDQCYYTSWREYPDYPTAEYTIQRFYSQSGSFVQVLPPKGEMRCGQNYNIDVQYILTMAGVGKGAEKATFYFLVMSRAEIVHYGQQEVDFKDSVSSSFSFDLPITASFAPSADFVVYSILQKEIIVDTVRLSIEKCFKNEVSLSFSEEQGAPASSVDLLFAGAADSLCAFRVIDYSLMLLNPYESFSAESVYNSMRYRSLYGYYVNRFNVEDTEPPCDDPDKQIFYNGNYYVPVSSEREGDSYQKVKKLGLVFGTQARLRKPMVCKKETQQHVYPLIMESSSLRGFSPAAKPMMKNAGLLADVSDMEAPMSAATEQTGSIETVRKNFADNWVWEIASVGSDGRGTIPLVVPDTITQWKGSMFCVSEQEGFGMTRSPANFTSFQPFFAEMSLPYSIVRGETLVLKAFVPNYLEYCIKQALHRLIKMTSRQKIKGDKTSKQGPQSSTLSTFFATREQTDTEHSQTIMEDTENQVQSTLDTTSSQSQLTHIQTIMEKLPSKSDIADLKAFIKSEITTMRKDINDLGARIEDLEEAQDTINTMISSTETCLAQHASTISTLQNKVEDLENRSRRNNLRIRGLPEEITPDKLQPYLIGGTMHWERERKNEKINIPFLPHPNSPADVEITSYILLSIAKGPNITKDDSNTMAQIAVWVIQQQNSNGGFRSTQDTVVALQALSASAQVIYTPNAHHNVIVTRRNRAVKKGNMKVAQCSMNQENRLLVQRQSLTKVPGDYTIFVSGTGCCLIQTTVKYNVPVSQEKSAFSLSVTSSSESCVNGVAYTFTIGINISYRGSRQKPNMVIIDIKMLSGYTADYWSLREMTKSKLVSKSEEQNGHVFLYLNSVSCVPRSLCLCALSIAL